MALSGVLPNPLGLRNSPFQSGLNKGNMPDTGVSTATPSAQQYNGYFANASILGTPFTVFLGLILLLAFFKFFSENDATELDPFDFRVSGYNVAAVGVSAVVFIVLFKVVANRYPIPGLTDIANFV